MTVCSEPASSLTTPSAPSPIELSSVQRVRQAARADSSPAILRELARDPEIIVRAAVAMNAQSCSAVDTILASDEDDRVRALLGCRIARLLPNLDASSQDNAAHHVTSMLGILARDQATRVRAAIADEIKSMEAAPRDLVLLLAADRAIEVSDPIIRLSPVLTDADLLALLATPPTAKSAQAVASRPKLSANVAEAIVQHADAPAIRALLANQSAFIQESTLDALVGRAPDHVDWHAPLVRRPLLSTKAVRALSEFIAADLLRVLASRPDFDATKIDIVRRRLAMDAAARDEDPAAEGQRLKASDGLTEASLFEAAHAGNLARLTCLLAVASGVSLRMVDRAVELRSAKALVSLVWRSGFSVQLAVTVQTVLAQFGPDDMLYPTSAGKYPLSTEEMEWQLELMAEPPSAVTAGRHSQAGSERHSKPL